MPIRPGLDYGKALGDYNYRHHEVCLRRSDWERFADALYDTFPDGRYFYNPPVFYRMWAEPPPCMQGEHMFRLHDDVSDLNPQHHSQTEMHFDPHWQPEWYVTGDPINDFLPEPGSYWDLYQPDFPSFRFEFSCIKAAEDGHPEHMTNHGEYWFFYQPGNRTHYEIGHKVFRLLREVATNRDQLTVQGLDGKVVERRPLSGIWLGQDAIAWAREDSSRLLAYGAHGKNPMGIRPVD